MIGEGKYQERRGGASEGITLRAPEILVGSAGRLANGGVYLPCLSHRGFGHWSITCVLGSC